MIPDDEAEVLEDTEQTTDEAGDATDLPPIKMLDDDDVESADLETLTAFFNNFSKRKVKQFADRPTAQKRCRALIKKLNEGEAPMPPSAEEVEAAKAVTAQKRSEGTKRTWTDEAIKARRSQRHGVEVDGVYYPSVAKAHVDLGIPLNDHIRLRASIKNLPEGEYETAHGRRWQAVPYRSEAKPKAPKAAPADADAEAVTEPAE